MRIGVLIGLIRETNAMRAVLQRCLEASVTVDNVVVGKINHGLVVLLGVAAGDGESDVNYMVEKVIGLRIFDDEQGKMNRSLLEVAGQLLVISQFTLLGDTHKGRRPSFINAADPALGQRLYELFISRSKEQGMDVQSGVFRANMQVSLVNDGPVTILLDTHKRT
jgi:D-tyrosyl-tRNA(Tyr) deacylase